MAKALVIFIALFFISFANAIYPMPIPGASNNVLKSDGTNWVSGAVPLGAPSGILPVANGGTGLSSGTDGGILAFSATGTIVSSGLLTANQLIKGGGAGVAPSTLTAGSQYQVLVMGAANPGYGQVNLSQSAAITGTLPVGNGGTGTTSFGAHHIWIGNGTSAPTEYAIGGGQIMVGVASADPSFTANPTLGVAATTSGTLSLANGSGGGASVAIKNLSTTSAWNFNLPSTAGSSSDVLTSAGGASSDMTWTGAVSTNTNSTIVKRDGSGNFSAGTITAALTGTASGNATITPTNHGVVLSGSANAVTATAAGSAGQVLTSGGASADPVWTTATYPATVATGDILTATGTNALGVIAASTSGYVLTANGAGVAATWQAASASGGSTGVYAYNFLLNGGFDWWQFGGTSATVTAAGGGTPTSVYLYMPDQWYVRNVLGGGTVEGIITFSQQTAVTNGSGYGARVKITTAPTGTGIQNGAELWQTLSNVATVPLIGATASVGGLIRCLGNVDQVGVQFFYGTTEVKAGVANTIGSEATATCNTTTFVTLKTEGISLGTSMTRAGTIGIRIRPTHVSSGNLYDLNNGYEVEQWMLNVGSTLATFNRQHSNPADELHALQYFYEKSYDPTTAIATSTDIGEWIFQDWTTSSNLAHTIRSVCKRADPSLRTWDRAGNATRASVYTLGGWVRTDNQNVLNGNNYLSQCSVQISTVVSTASNYGWHWELDSRL